MAKPMDVIDDTMREFQAAVWRYYDQHGRHDLPWRQPDVDGSFSPYKIMVSELMLQQTQVSRVVPKYYEFLERFPDASFLARAPLGDVLVAWQGLGYNRRAKYLWQAAQMVTSQLHGDFPKDQKELTALPGVGWNTAGAIMAYAYDAPVRFIETNVRTVYIHHFFDDRTDVSDKEIEQLAATGGRSWHWALMDYGVHIKQTHGNKSRASKSYSKQSPFQGSRRQVRGAVVRYLSQRSASREVLAAGPGLQGDPRLDSVLADLVREGLVVERSGSYSLH